MGYSEFQINIPSWLSSSPPSRVISILQVAQISDFRNQLAIGSSGFNFIRWSARLHAIWLSTWRSGRPAHVLALRRARGDGDVTPRAEVSSISNYGFGLTNRVGFPQTNLP